MRDNFFNIGMKVQLQIKDGKEDNQFFPSKIEDVDGKDLTVGMPIKSNYVYFVPLHESVYVYFSRKDSFYCMECKVIKRKYEPIPVLTLRPLKPPYKYQRRNFFRIAITLDIEVIKQTDEVLKGKTKDISGSGALLALPQELKKGEVVKLSIYIKGKPLKLKAKVVRCYKDDTRHFNPYYVAVQFIEIDEKIQDEIVKFTLEEQRKLRKKGII